MTNPLTDDEQARVAMQSDPDIDAERQAEQADYARRNALIAKAMQGITNPICPRCGSCCYGDCEVN